MSIVEYLSQPLWQRLGLTLVHFLWQGLAVAVLVGVFVRVLRLKHGNARYGAYLLAFIAMIACPIVTFTAIDIPINPDTELVTGEESAEVVDISPSPYTTLPAVDVLPEVETPRPAIPTLADSIPLGQRISGWLNVSMPWVLVIWMAGVAVLSVRLLMGFVGVYRWRHHLDPLPERLVPRIASLSEVLGMRRFSRVFISPTVLQAMAVGYLRPIVLLPAAMLTQMQPEMLEAVIAHELAHIRRFDLWVNLIQRITETLLFYHPAVWWLSYCIRSERELCCDELAVKATGERITYASTLESVGRARFMAKPPVLAAGLGQDNKPTLGRVRHILGLKPAQRNCPFWLAGVITVLFLAALVIPTTLALTNRSDEKLNDFESVVVEGIGVNRDKFKCGYLAWNSKHITTAFLGPGQPPTELEGEYEFWWDGEKMASKCLVDLVYKDPEGNLSFKKQQDSTSYDGGWLSRKPKFGGDQNWLGPQRTRWRGRGSQDWLIRQESKQEGIRKNWSVIDVNGAKLIRCKAKNMNETDRDYGGYTIKDYDPSKGYGLANEEWYNPDGSPRLRHTVKMLEVIPGGWFPVEVDFKSFSITDGKVYSHYHCALDVERCSFNDKSAFPAGIFKGAVDKQLKYQEKLQKYLAMELEGISDIKEAAKADKIKRDAREAIEQFVAAARVGDFEKAGEYAHPDKLPVNQIADFNEMAKGQNLWIMAVVADDFHAIAVSSVILGDHERTGPLVFLLDREPQNGRDNWWVDDIDMETPDSAEVELKQFLEKHPQAKNVPYEKNAAGAEVPNDLMAMKDDQGDIRVITNDTTGAQRIQALLIKPEIVTASDGRAKLSYLARYVHCRELAKWVIEKFGFITDKDITCDEGKNQISILCPTTGDAETVFKFLQEVDVEPIKVRMDLLVVETYPDVEPDWETREAVRNITHTKTTSNAKPEKSLSVPDILRESVKTEPQPENSIEKLVDLLTSRGYLKILMNPTLEVVNGKTAKVQSSYREPTGKEIIDSFEVTPQILDDGNIDVATKMVFQNEQIGDPRTHINIKDSGSLVIGSVTKTEKRDIVRDGVKGSEERTTEVLVILTLTIITPEMNLSKKSDVEGKSQHIDVETLLNKVRHAQRPTANMIVEWQYESPQPVFVTPPRSREPDFSPPSRILKTYKAIIAGDKSRIEERELTFQSQKDTEPSRIREITYVFDGTMQKQLDHFIKGFENEYRGYRHTYDKNTQLLLKLLLAYPPFLDNPKLSEQYNIKVIESKEKGLIILETSKEDSGIHRFTIDPDKDFNIVKQEVIVSRGKAYEINCIVKKQANGLWYQVAREQIRYSEKTGKPFLENKVTITKLDFNPEIPTGAFELQFPKGIKIWDGSLKDWIIVGEEEETSREPAAQVEGTGTTAEKESEFSAILSNGVTVELIGMCEYPSVGKQWWRPDGSLLVNPPYDESDIDILSVRKPDAIPIEFAFRLSGNLGEPAWEARVKGYEQAFVWWTGRRAKDGKFLTDIKSIGMFVKSDQRTLDLRLGFSIADGPYEWVDFKNISIKPNFKPDVDVEVEGGWGEAVEGIHMRVRAERQRWYEGETPKFRVDMRNKGTVEWELGLTQENWEVELDGVWHRVGASFTGDFRTLLFGPGQEHKDIEFYPEVRSEWNINGKPLKFTPGLHTVRLSFGPSTRDRAYWRRLRVVSNPVVIEILPKGERDGTVEDEGDAATSLQAELHELWRQRDQGLAGAEAFGKRLLEKYTKREEKPLIYYQLAEIYAQSGQADPNKIVEFARQGWWFLNDPVKKARLFVYWGDALQLTKGREEAARIYLRGLQFCLQYGLPKEKPELPTVSINTVDGPSEEVENYDKEDKRQMDARKHAKLIGELIEHRQILTGRIVQLYAPLPDAFDELHELVMRYLGSEQASQQIIAAAKSYRTDHKTAIPVIMSIGGDPNPKADLDWGEETKGIRVRLRADTKSWGASGVPKFKLDVRNDGSHILMLTSAPDCWSIEVDGVWYRVTIPMLGGAKGMSFGPDKRWYNLELSLDMALGSQNENVGFELAPGWHTVRAALAKGLSEDGKMFSVGAVSNPVKIVILPTGSDETRSAG